jgi:uncharacterized protein YfbU (UPF0304 family)
MDVITLTPVERLQLVNQFLILEKLYPDLAEQYAAQRAVIEKGFTIQYDDIFDSLYDEMTEDECRYVYDVLDLFRLLITSYNALADKEGLTPEDVRFQGFDLNNEDKNFSLAKHLQEQGKWAETLTGNLNSHSQRTMWLYPHMLKKFKPIGDQLKASGNMHWLLTAAQIREIIS